MILHLVIILSLVNVNRVRSSSVEDIRQVSSLIKTLRSSQTDRINLRDNRCTFLAPDFCNYRGTCYLDSNNKPRCACIYPYAEPYCEELSGMYYSVSMLVFLIKNDIFKSTDNAFFEVHLDSIS
jgi:hypothetical protein